jgi:endo-1,4-beta-xylanase
MLLVSGCKFGFSATLKKEAPSPAFVPVTDITGLPSGTWIGAPSPLKLSGKVWPADATDQTIVWTVVGEVIPEGMDLKSGEFSPTAEGEVFMQAVIARGRAGNKPFSKSFSIKVTQDFVAVTDVTGVPRNVIAGTPITLSASVSPAGATCTGIDWSVLYSGLDEWIKIEGDTLTAGEPAVVLLRAVIVNGKAAGEPFIKDFPVTITKDFVSVGEIRGIPSSWIVEEPLLLHDPVNGIGIVSPEEATNKTIEWSLIDWDNRLAEALLNDDILETSLPVGTEVESTDIWWVEVRGTIAGGLENNGSYTQPFIINLIPVGTFVPVQEIINVPTSVLKGETLQLTGTVKDIYGDNNATNTTILWTIEDGGSATWAILDGSTLTASYVGTVRLKATIEKAANKGEDFVAYFDIQILPSYTEVQSIVGVPTGWIVGNALPLGELAAAVPANATNRGIVWSVTSAGETGAVLDDSGVLSVDSPGEVTLQASIADAVIDDDASEVEYSDYTESFTITFVEAGDFVPAEAESITLQTNTIKAGTSLRLVPVVGGDPTNKTVVWCVVNSLGNIAQLDGDLLYASGGGYVELEARIEGGGDNTLTVTKQLTVEVRP